MLERAKEPWEHKPLSPSLPAYQRFLLLLQRQSEGVYYFKHDFNTGKDADFVGHGHFLCREVGFFLFFFPNGPWWSSCSSAFILFWNRSFDSHLCFNPSLSPRQGWNCFAVVVRSNHTVSLSQRLSRAHGCLPNTEAEENVKCCKRDKVTTLLLRVFWSPVFPGLCATGWLRVHYFLLRKSFVRVGG